MDDIRALLYPLGLLSTLFFTSRFFLQWIESEKKKESQVTKVFWLLSLAGNFTLALHALIQLQFPLAVLQGVGAAIAWRNCDLMREKPTPLKQFLPKMIALPLLIAALFLIQSLILHTFEWMRSPVMPWSEGSSSPAGFAWHLVGLAGMLLFSSRFWIQWWHAERQQESKLGAAFWWMSIIGSILSLFYFVRLHDFVNIVGYSVGVIPYIRNLMLLPSKNPQNKKSIFIFAGEQSGDHLGGDLVLQLKQRGYSLFGVGGKKMIGSGMKPFLPMESFQVMGITSVLFALPRLLFNLHKIKKKILLENPQSVILIDYPDFNMLLARRLRKSKYEGKIIHYVSPSVWAWRKGRVKVLSKNLDLLLTILPFEKSYYEKTSLPVVYVGHPLIATLKNHAYTSSWREKCNIPRDKKIVGIFPGSRMHEIDHNLPLQLEAAALMRDPSLFFVVSCARENLLKKIEEYVNKSVLQCVVVPFSSSYDLMKECVAAIATSGTVTLELALHKTPTLVTYKLSLLNYLVGRYFFRIKLPHFSLPNIILKRELYPEFVHRKLSSKEIGSALERLFEKNKEIQVGCVEVADVLQEIDSSHLAADAIDDLISQDRQDKRKI